MNSDHIKPSYPSDVPVNTVPNHNLSDILDYVEYTSLMVNMSRHCNLDCKLCYVDKTIPFDELDDESILGFIERYRSYVDQGFGADLNICLCGHGELFSRPTMPAFINRLVNSPIHDVRLITNGTIDRLEKLERFDKLHFDVSLDLPQSFSDWNRGEGTFDKVSSFIRHAVSCGSKGLMVQSILTRQNYKQALDEGVDYVMNELGAESVSLIPLYFSDVTNRGMFYVSKYNQDDLCLRPQEIDEIRQHRHADCLCHASLYLPRYLTLYSNGQVFNCSDSVVAIGSHDEDIDSLFAKLVASKHCGFCCAPRP